MTTRHWNRISFPLPDELIEEVNAWRQRLDPPVEFAVVVRMLV